MIRAIIEWLQKALVEVEEPEADVLPFRPRQESRLKEYHNHGHE